MTNIVEPCVLCSSPTGFEVATGYETVVVRGVSYEVPSGGATCRGCGETFEDDRDPLHAAYEMYRKQHGLISPGAFADMRRSSGLSAEEFGALAGISVSEITRFEAGALLDPECDARLRIASDPALFLV